MAAFALCGTGERDDGRAGIRTGRLMRRLPRLIRPAVLTNVPESLETGRVSASATRHSGDIYLAPVLDTPGPAPRQPSVRFCTLRIR